MLVIRQFPSLRHLNSGWCAISSNTFRFNGTRYVQVMQELGQYLDEVARFFWAERDGADYTLEARRIRHGQ